MLYNIKTCIFHYNAKTASVTIGVRDAVRVRGGGETGYLRTMTFLPPTT